MERRVFLKRGLLGGALLALGGAGGLAMWPGDRSARPSRPLKVIDEAVFGVLVAVAGRVCHGTTARPLEVAQRVDDALQFTYPEAQKDLNAVLGLLENGLAGLALRGSPKPFTLLDEAGQDAALLAWRDSSITLLRGAYHALRKLCLAAHYAQPTSWGEVAYGGPLIQQPEAPAITADGALVVDVRPDPTELPQ
jgi:hypothetical protein